MVLSSLLSVMIQVKKILELRQRKLQREQQMLKERELQSMNQLKDLLII